MQAFNIRLVEKTTANWEFMFGVLETFTKREGHARMPNAGVQAGAWIRGRALKTRTTGRLAIQCLLAEQWNRADTWRCGGASAVHDAFYIEPEVALRI